MRHQPRSQTKDTTKAAAFSPQATRTTRASGHPILQRQALYGNQATNHWLDEQTQETEAIQPSLTAATPSSFRGISQAFGSSRPSVPIQAKLMVGAVGDKYEQEADRVAAEVVERINAPSPQPSGESKAIQRRGEPEEALQMKPMTETVQRKGEEDDELQMKPMVQRVGAEGDAVSADLEGEINSARGGGQSLAPQLQAQMGQAMGADFSGVRVHTDGRSDQLNQSIQAKAFTTGQDIFFRQGAYSPGNRSGKQLIAHELTHVMQQKNVQLTVLQTKGDTTQRISVRDRINQFEKVAVATVNKPISGKTQSLGQGHTRSKGGTPNEPSVKYHEQLYTALNQWGSKKETIGALLDYAAASGGLIQRLDRQGVLSGGFSMTNLEYHLDVLSGPQYMAMDAIYQSYDELFTETKQTAVIQNLQMPAHQDDIDWQGLRNFLMIKPKPSSNKFELLLSTYNQYIDTLDRILTYTNQGLEQLHVMQVTWEQLQNLYAARNEWRDRLKKINDGIFLVYKWTHLVRRIVNGARKLAQERMNQLKNEKVIPSTEKPGEWLNQRGQVSSKNKSPEIAGSIKFESDSTGYL